MGTMYYARNLVTKKAYELGKGAWGRIATDGFIDATDAARLQKEISAKVIVSGGWVQETVDDIAYHQMIAEALSKLGDQLELVSDMGEDSPTEGFEVVGTRYPLTDATIAEG